MTTLTFKEYLLKATNHHCKDSHVAARAKRLVNKGGLKVSTIHTIDTICPGIIDTANEFGNPEPEAITAIRNPGLTLGTTYTAGNGITVSATEVALTHLVGDLTNMYGSPSSVVASLGTGALQTSATTVIAAINEVRATANAGTAGAALLKSICNQHGNNGKELSKLLEYVLKSTYIPTPEIAGGTFYKCLALVMKVTQGTPGTQTVHFSGPNNKAGCGTKVHEAIINALHVGNDLYKALSDPVLDSTYNSPTRALSYDLVEALKGEICDHQFVS